MDEIVPICPLIEINGIHQECEQEHCAWYVLRWDEDDDAFWMCAVAMIALSLVSLEERHANEPG